MFNKVKFAQRVILVHVANDVVIIIIFSPPLDPSAHQSSLVAATGRFFERHEGGRGLLFEL